MGFKSNRLHLISKNNDLVSKALKSNLNGFSLVFSINRQFKLKASCFLFSGFLNTPKTQVLNFWPAQVIYKN